MIWMQVHRSYLGMFCRTMGVLSYNGCGSRARMLTHACLRCLPVSNRKASIHHWCKFKFCLVDSDRIRVKIASFWVRHIDHLRYSKRHWNWSRPEDKTTLNILQHFWYRVSRSDRQKLPLTTFNRRKLRYQKRPALVGYKSGIIPVQTCVPRSKGHGLENVSLKCGKLVMIYALQPPSRQTRFFCLCKMFIGMSWYW